MRTTWTPSARRSRRTATPASSGQRAGQLLASWIASSASGSVLAPAAISPTMATIARASGSIAAGGPGGSRGCAAASGSPRRRADVGGRRSETLAREQLERRRVRPRPAERAERGGASAPGPGVSSSSAAIGREQRRAQLAAVAAGRDAARCAAARRGGRRASRQLPGRRRACRRRSSSPPYAAAQHGRLGGASRAACGERRALACAARRRAARAACASSLSAVGASSAGTLASASSSTLGAASPCPASTSAARASSRNCGAMPLRVRSAT